MKTSSVLLFATGLLLSSVDETRAGSEAAVTFEVRGMQKTASGAT